MKEAAYVKIKTSNLNIFTDTEMPGEDLRQVYINRRFDCGKQYSCLFSCLLKLIIKKRRPKDCHNKAA